ncbi:LysR family transcriptional regulator [Salinibacterium sp. M195]|uniref:LysR family transcriptional regulator n=1 Tax=Salinibacterium sp. M195 TaxID=2583374 RepID=UPI0021023AF1|nr:LysR family transcriptional regulator [Salinibacterium sp. M195]
MEFRQLEVFRTIAAELHFGKAAKRLFIAQASVSQMLQKLEDDVGVRLVHRSSRTVQLTPAGTVFLSEIERVFAAVERSVSLAQQAARRGGSLRIATNYPASRLLLLPLLADLRNREPGMTTMLREMASQDQLKALVRGDLDLGLVYGPVDEEGISSQFLLSVPVVAMVRAGHPLSNASEASFGEIARYLQLAGTDPTSSAIESAVLSASQSQGIGLQKAASRTDPASYHLELETTDSVGFASLPRAEQSKANGLHMLRLTPIEPTVDIHVAWSARHSEPLVNSVVESLIQLAESLR